MRHPRCTRFILAPGVALLALLPAAAHAQPVLDRLIKAATTYGPFLNLSDNSPGGGLRHAAGILGLLIAALLAFLGVVFLILMISAGLRWMTARGNEQQVEKAKDTIQSAAIGLLIVILAYALVTFAATLITETGLLKKPT